MANKINYIKDFPIFWYDSNEYSAYIRSIDDLEKVIKAQTDSRYGAFKTRDEFFDKSYRVNIEGLNFGTRNEHTGKETLRGFLEENNIKI